VRYGLYDQDRGAAGQGIQTIGNTLATCSPGPGSMSSRTRTMSPACAAAITTTRVRLADRPVMAPKDAVDIIVALDKESIRLHEHELTPRGQIIYDADTLKEKHDKPAFLDIPFSRLATEHGGDKIMANTVATGAVLACSAWTSGILLGIIDETFRKKGEKVITANRNAALPGTIMRSRAASNATLQSLLTKRPVRTCLWAAPRPSPWAPWRRA